MISMPKVQSIRRRRMNGESIASIARSENVSEPTVRKYLKTGDLSPRPPVKRKHAESVIDRYVPVIEQWLAEDRCTWRKQRHTATRIWERLRDEYGAEVSLSTVTRKVAQLRREFAAEREAGYLDLVWHPGEAQADFGEVDVRFRGEVSRMRHFVLDFPYSNVGPAQLMPGENAECACQALRDIFEWLGGVPPRIVFDNAAGVGRRMFERVRLTRLFQSFQAHYGFEYVFCNAYAGHEKGGVESRVGAVRRKLFVPVPSVWSMPAFNVRLLERCLALGDKDHYRKGGRETDLFAEDRKALLALPEARFDVVTWKRMKADKYGIVTVEGRHRYAAGPEHAGRELIVGLRAFEVELLDASGARITTHPRAYGDNPTSSDDPSLRIGLPWRQARGLAQQPGPRGASRPAARMARRAGARGPRRGAAHAQAGRTRERMGERGGGDGRDPRDHRRHRPRRRMPGRGPTRRRDRARRLRRARRPDRIRPGVRREEGQRMSQRNEERTDIDRLRARARALFISQATIDDLLAWATPRQLQAVDRLLHTELDNRETSKRARLLRRARFPVPKTLDGYDFTNVKLPDGYARDELLSLDFVGRAQDLVFYGKTGRGKTHLATALGMSAIDRGMNVRFLPTAELVLQLGRAKREGTLETMLKDIAKADLIILDEFGYVPFDVDGARLLYQVIAGSYERRSIIFTTNIEFSKWGTIFADDKLAASIIDRIVHHGRLIEFTGQSHRISQALMFGKPQNQ
ncbi:putative transposase fused to DNA replication protein [Bifidobacterium pullorum subsp. gallinarum]|uniref:Putative transposase fused to DNA replication protein n=2 Tax=Bifidobacterium pullorum TaxID=78448 RepID=A0A087ARU5_9BIFI|nr:putative transposase fused to DNA replication protein [Bifidobacterium pullorum subsp. gallinarum]